MLFSMKVKHWIGGAVLLMAASVTTTAMAQLVAPTYPMVVDPNSGRYYELITDLVDFNTAKTIAESHEYNGVQGRLAVITNDMQTMFATLASTPGNTWIGLTDDPTYGGTESSGDIPQGWVWTGPDGATPLTTSDYEYWWRDSGGALLEPNGGTTENAVAVRQIRAGGWCDFSLDSTNFALVEFGQEQEVAKGFYHRRVSGAIDSAKTTTDAMKLINGLSTATSAEINSQTATFNFADINAADTSAYGYALSARGTTVFPGDDLAADDNDFAMKSYVTVEITEAGTYTIGGYHDDLMAFSIDRGAQEAANITLADWPSFMPKPDRGFGVGTATVTFDAPGTYNIYCLYAEDSGGSGAEIFVAKGDYSLDSAADATEFFATHDSFKANGALIGDTVNGGLATKNLRQIHTQSGFTINGTTTATTINHSSAPTGVNSFGSNQTMTADAAMSITSQLVVPEGAGGYWTLGVNQSREGTLTITDSNSQVVAFTQANGASNGATVATNGAMTWNTPAGVADKALGAIYLEPGTYNLALDYNPNSQTTSAPTLNVVNGTFNVLNATPVDNEITNLQDAITLVYEARDYGTSGGNVANYATGTYSKINLDEEGRDTGHFANTDHYLLFPEGQPDDTVDLANLITADIQVTAENAGMWSFCVTSDDGFGMQIYDQYGTALSFNEFAGTTSEDDSTFFVYDEGRSVGDSLATINLPEGTYSLAMVHFDWAKESHLEISCAKGEFLEFDASLFNLLGGDFVDQLELFAAAGVHSEFDLSFDLLGDAIDFEEFSPEEPKIAGDANNDGKVDGSDVTILAGNWQAGVGNPDPSTVTWEMGDFNGDGQVDGSDVTILAGNWQYGVDATAAAVPEPSMLILLLGGVATLLVTRRRK